MHDLTALRNFARATVQKYSGSKFPWSPGVTDIRSHYVDLRVADSTGTLLPVRDLLRQGTRLILVGDPGSGKTTTLREFAVRGSEHFIDGKTDLLPIYLSLREVFPTATAELRPAISLSDDDLGRQQFLLLLDGLDEVPLHARASTLREVSHFGVQYPSAQLVLASRPSGLSPPPPEDFRYYHLESLDSAQVLDVIARLNADKTQIEAFQNSLASSSFLEGLSRSPLLVQLIWQVFQSNNRLPEARAELYRMASDLLLYQWDTARGITRDSGALSIARVQDVLSAVALEALAQSLHQIPIEQLKSTLVAHLGPAGADPDAINATISQLLSSGLLVEVNQVAVAFAHLSFMEFYAARQLASNPRRLASLLADNSPQTKEVALFAAGMLSDVAPLVEAAVDRRELILAANCLREGITENRTLEAYVLDQLRRELGNALVSKLTAISSSHRIPLHEETIHSQLVGLLESSQSQAHPGSKRGKLFENFAERFFRQCFDIVAVNANTENGELDLILGNMHTDPFWSEWGGDILVECKNWNSSRPLKEVATFAHKVRMSRSKLGFFVSMSGFTEDAVRTLRNQVSDRAAPLVVPLAGSEITAMLSNREKFDPFFRRIIRNFKHLNKW